MIPLNLVSVFFSNLHPKRCKVCHKVIVKDFIYKDVKIMFFNEYVQSLTFHVEPSLFPQGNFSIYYLKFQQNRPSGFCQIILQSIFSNKIIHFLNSRKQIEQL